VEKASVRFMQKSFLIGTEKQSDEIHLIFHRVTAKITQTHTHTHPFNGPFPGLPR